MSQDEQQQAICESCKSDLNKEPHKEDCKILAKMKSDEAQKIAEKEKQESDRLALEATEKARIELDKINAANLEKAKEELRLKQEAERQANEKNKIEENTLRLKNVTIDKIYKLDPNSEKEFAREDLIKTYTLAQLADFYNKLLEIIKENENSEFHFIVNCSLCNKEIGKKNNEQDAKLLLKKHKQEVHGEQKSNWVVIALITSILAAGAYAGFKIYKKRKENGL